MSENKKAIIIGSGVAGLATATRLALQGFEVTVYERNASPGGKVAMFKKDGFQFDSGPSLFTQPQNIVTLFEDAGEPVEAYFKFKPVPVSCKYFYESGKIITAYTDNEALAEELNVQAGEDKNAVLNYLSRAALLYNKTGKIFLNFSLHKRNTWLHKRIFSAIKSLKFSYLFKSLHQYNTSRFTSPETIQLFNRFATYNGSNPYKAPAMLSLIPHIELNEGVFFPQGGMMSISNAIYELALKKGVQFYFNTPVQRIVHADGKVIGAVVNNQNVYADVIVSNADIYFTYKKLLRQDIKAKNILKQERSSSAIIFYWGIKTYFPQLELHNIFFSRDYKEEFNKIFNSNSVTSDPTIYINVTSKEEPLHAPPGKENWFVMINVAADKGQDWDKIIQDAKENIIKKLNRLLNTDVLSLIESETITDPLTIEKQSGSYRGSLYGTSSNSKMAAFLRAPNFTADIKNLYHCGGSVHPGGGIPLCFKSAKITAELIRQDFINKAIH